MSEIAPVYQHPALTLEQVIVGGDLAALKPEERLEYYNNVCKSVGLNPLTRPLEYIKLNGKLTLYARKDCADQLRKINGVNCEILDRRITEGVAVVHVKATDKTGRHDEDIGVVAAANLRGDALANALMKAVTKAKRRVTLSICGLGWLDESEIESIPDAEHVDIDDKPEQPKVISDKHHKYIEMLMTNHKIDREEVRKDNEVDHFDTIPVGKFDTVLSDILDKIIIKAESVEVLQTIADDLDRYEKAGKINAEALRMAYAAKMRELAKKHKADDKD